MDCSKPKLWFLCIEIKHKKVWEQSIIGGKSIFTFIKTDIDLNILKRYIPKIKELVQDSFIIIRHNASYHCNQK